MLISASVLLEWEFCSMVSVSSLNFPGQLWLSVACFSGLLDWCVHWEMLVGVGYLGN